MLKNYVFGLAVLLLASNPVFAQSSATVNHAGAAKSHGHEGKVMRASNLVGLNVTNASNETVGEIGDLVLDDSTGKVKYVALSVGGFLGLGDKMFAIPISAFQCSQNKDGEMTAMLNVSEKDFENATGFDQDNWPNMADRQWDDRNNKAFAHLSHTKHESGAVHDDHLEKAENRRKMEAAAQSKSGRGVYRVSELMGLNVGDGNDETIGEINDLMIGSRRGKVIYVAFAAGGTLGFGDSLFAIPFDRFNLRRNEDKDALATLDATKQQFENAEGFDEDNWPKQVDERWMEKNDRGYSSLKSHQRYDDEHAGGSGK